MSSTLHFSPPTATADYHRAPSPRLEEAFRKFHGSSNLLEAWASWLQLVVKRVVGPHEGTSTLAARAGSFHLRWCLVRYRTDDQSLQKKSASLSFILLLLFLCSSLVIRDLTLRSADSFGMFHLMRLLCDGASAVHAARATTPLSFRFSPHPFLDCVEYIFFLLEKTVMAGRCPHVDHQPDGGEERKVESKGSIASLLLLILHLTLRYAFRSAVVHGGDGGEARQQLNGIVQCRPRPEAVQSTLIGPSRDWGCGS